ncbi:MAG: hypothetical protein OEV66_00620 [Spirochaetia bacterium]|nr:hypothetical protein [Spirochaetia bacterium]
MSYLRHGIQIIRYSGERKNSPGLFLIGDDPATDRRSSAAQRRSRPIKGASRQTQLKTKYHD